MEKEDVLLAYIEYLISLVKRADETVVIQSDDRILEGFRYEKEVEHFLKTAVDKDLFEVYYQPVFWTKEDRYITLEALSRLKHPCMGMIRRMCLSVLQKGRGSLHRSDCFSSEGCAVLLKRMNI